MTITELNAVIYAARFASYCGGSHYGQDGGAGPGAYGLNDEEASYVRGAVSRGMNTASAVADGQPANAEHHVAEFGMMVRQAERHAKLDEHTMRAAYNIGYTRVKAVRERN